jgi:hypothetical protein
MPMFGDMTAAIFRETFVPGACARPPMARSRS